MIDDLHLTNIALHHALCNYSFWAGGPVLREVLSELLVFYGLKLLGKINGYV